MSDTSNVGIVGFVLGKGFFQQLVFTLVILTLLFFVFITFEYIMLSVRSLSGRHVELLPYTVTAEDKQITFEQNPSKPQAVSLPLSNNERTGIEFTYSMYLYINPSTFTGEDTLYHVLHKGYATPWPLMGPGLFVRGNSNTLRVIMNTYKNPYTYMDVENIPIRKWFHIALVCRKNSLEIYINGNLRKKLPFEGTLPYQNFQNLILFCPLKFYFEKQPKIAGLSESIRIEGAFRGNMSNLIYLPYAASFTEIAGLQNKGVSSKTLKKTEDMPPYLIDTYWTTTYQLQE